MSKKNLFLVSFFLSLLSQSYSMYIQSFDKGNFSISEKLKKKLDSSNLLRNDDILSPEIININTDTISADQEHSIKLQLPYKTGDLGTDIMELLYVKKSGKLFSIKNYNVTYFLNEENVIHSIYPNMFPDDIEDSIENDVDCNYTILDNKFILEKYKVKKYKKIVFYSFITLGIDNDIVKKIEYYNNKYLNESDIGKNINKGKEYFNNSCIIFLDMFKIEQMFFDKKYFVFLAKNNINTNIDNNNLLLLFYEINLLYYEQFNLNLDFFLNINKININNNTLIKEESNIEKIGYFKNYIFLLISTKNNTELIILDNTNKIISLEEVIYNEVNIENKIDIKNDNIIDFLLYKKIFILLTEKKGLFLYNIKEIYTSNDSNNIIIKFYFNNNFNFEFGQKLEIYRNPFYGGIFLGVLFNNINHNNINNKKGNEIYLEILLDEINDDSNNKDKIEIKINKIITASKKRNFLLLNINNDFFIYFYDKETKELFIYRKGLLNVIPYVTYKLNLLQDKINKDILYNENITNIIPLYNKKEGKFDLVLIGNNYILVKNLTLASHNLNCTFHDIGSYNLTFILKGEVCANSLKKIVEGTYGSCHKIIKYNFHVYMRNTAKRIILFISILLTIILLATILFICYSIETGCFGKYKNSKTYKIKKILFSSRLDTEENFTSSKQKDN